MKQEAARSFSRAVVHPFHGSGTLGVCCEKLNKEGHKIDWVGIEMEEKWVEVANKRLENV